MWFHLYEILGRKSNRVTKSRPMLSQSGWRRNMKELCRIGMFYILISETITWIYIHTHIHTHTHTHTHTYTAAAAKSLQSCLTLCDPIDGSPPGSPIPGILKARTLEWVAISFSNARKWKVKVKSLSRVWLSDPTDCSLPGSSIHGILQARVLEWGAIAFSNTYVYICIYHTSPNDTLKIAGFCYRCTLDSAKLRRNVPSLPWMEWGEKKL